MDAAFALDMDMDLAAQSPRTREAVAIHHGNRIVSAIVERHQSGLVFISDAGGAGLGPIAARKVVESAIRGALRACPATSHGGVRYLEVGPQIRDGRSFCASIARGLRDGKCEFAVE